MLTDIKSIIKSNTVILLLFHWFVGVANNTIQPTPQNITAVDPSLYNAQSAGEMMWFRVFGFGVLLMMFFSIFSENSLRRETIIWIASSSEILSTALCVCRQYLACCFKFWRKGVKDPSSIQLRAMSSDLLGSPLIWKFDGWTSSDSINSCDTCRAKWVWYSCSTKIQIADYENNCMP